MHNYIRWIFGLYKLVTFDQLYQAVNSGVMTELRVVSYKATTTDQYATMSNNSASISYKNAWMENGRHVEVVDARSNSHRGGVKLVFVDTKLFEFTHNATKRNVDTLSHNELAKLRHILLLVRQTVPKK